MIPDFKGHHFLEDSKPGEPPGLHHCDRCGLKASLRPDGSVFFTLNGTAYFLEQVTFPPSIRRAYPAAKRGWCIAQIKTLVLSNSDNRGRIKTVPTHACKTQTENLSISFACGPDAQLICHTYQFGQRFGFHLRHHPSSVSFYCPFGNAEIGASLFVE